MKPIQDLIAQGLDLHADVIPTVRQLAPNVEHKTNWTYFVGPLEDVLRRRHKPAEPAAGNSMNGTSTPAKRSDVWVWEGTPQWDAWSKMQAKPWPTSEQRHPAGGRKKGWYFPAEWPPGSQNQQGEQP